uniref:Uncharacterized protein n=1 Tax=Aegilops tauschii subsp. strangulata TaxID=200361 RepID=A0A453GC05_AEGTS
SRLPDVRPELHLLKPCQCSAPSSSFVAQGHGVVWDVPARTLKEAEDACLLAGPGASNGRPAPVAATNVRDLPRLPLSKAQGSKG